MTSASTPARSSGSVASADRSSQPIASLGMASLPSSFHSTRPIRSKPLPISMAMASPDRMNPRPIWTVSDPRAVSMCPWCHPSSHFLAPGCPLIGRKRKVPMPILPPPSAFPITTCREVCKRPAKSLPNFPSRLHHRPYRRRRLNKHWLDQFPHRSPALAVTCHVSVGQRPFSQDTLRKSRSSEVYSATSSPHRSRKEVSGRGWRACPCLRTAATALKSLDENTPGH
jgi:hypothetical protein